MFGIAFPTHVVSQCYFLKLLFFYLMLTLLVETVYNLLLIIYFSLIQLQVGYCCDSYIPTM